MIQKEAENSKSGAENGAEKTIDVGEMSEKNVGEVLTERQRIILKHIEQKNIISAKEISALLQIVDRTVEREIQKLKKMGILERVGGDRGGYWKVN